MDLVFRIAAYTMIIGLVVGLYPGVIRGNSAEPYKIGILMDLEGPNDLEPELVLDWAAELVNSAGGVNGRRVEMVYQDTFQTDIAESASQFLDDDDVQVVIGPETSLEAFKLAPLFIQKKKLLISPSATSADLFRAFAGKLFFLRTAQGDVEQARTIMGLLKERSARRVSLIYQDSAYGKTFLYWLPFFAQELDMELLEAVPYMAMNQEVSRTVDMALTGNPDCVVVAAFAEEAVLLKGEWDRRNPLSRLFLTDAAQTAYLVQQLGDAAEGLEGTSPTFDPGSGFQKAYVEKFGKQPLSYAATIWDSFLLAVYALARNEYKGGGEWIEDSLQAVTSGRGPAVKWNEIKRGLELIFSGNRPDVDGAAGPLEFDSEYGVDPVRSYYARWTVEDGGFRTVDVLSSYQSQRNDIEERVSAARSQANDRFKSFSLLDSGGDYRPGGRNGLQAVIVASTKGWENYRHQSDALVMYDLLRRNGIPDSSIILVLVDDLPSDEKNPLPGVVRHEVDGRNNRSGAQIDYAGQKVTASNLLRILTGNKTADTPKVIESNTGTDVLLYMVGHGLQGAVKYDYGPNMKADELAAAIDTMYEKGLFRQMLVMTELCFGASMGAGIDTPGVLYYTASNAREQSFGANYDAEVGAWLADDFTHQTVETLERNKAVYLTDLYSEVYSRVSGSHVQMLNYENFGNVRGVEVNDFFSY